MTIKITDRRTGEELSLRAFGVTETSDGHLIFGWEHYSYVRNPDDVNDDNYEVTFPEVEELKEASGLQEKEIEDWEERCEAIWAVLKKKGLAFPETEEDLEHFEKHFDDTYLEENIKLKQRIADLELEVAGQQKIIDENMGLGSTVQKSLH